MSLVIQSDYAYVVKALEETEADRSYLGHLVQEIKEMMRERGPVFLQTGRLHNRVADHLAYMSESGALN